MHRPMRWNDKPTRNAEEKKTRQTRKMCLVLCIKLAPSEPFHMRMDECKRYKIVSIYLCAAHGIRIFRHNKHQSFMSVPLDELKCYAIMMRFHRTPNFEPSSIDDVRNGPSRDTNRTNGDACRTDFLLLHFTAVNNSSQIESK